MAEDAVFNIVIGVQNRERIKQLEKDIADAEKEINNLSAAINTAGQATSQQANQLRMYGKDIQAYRQEISELSKANIHLGESSDSSGIGVRTLTREMFRLEEGGVGLLRTIPMIVDQLGGGAGLAAGFALVSAAVEVTSKHWDDLMDAFTNQSGLDAAKSAMERLADATKGIPGLGDIFARGAEVESDKAMLDRVEAKNKREEQKGKSIAESLTPEQKQRGGIFQKAAEEYGGERLLDETVERQRRGRNLSPAQMQEMRRRVQQQMGQAAQGKLPEGVQGELFGPEFGKEQERQQQKADFLQEQKATREEATERKASEAQIEQNKKADAAKQKKWEADEEKIMRSDEEFNKKRQEAILQDQLTQLERQKRDQAEAFHERQMDNKFTFHRGGQAIAEAYQTDATTAIQKNQLQVQKAMQAGIDAVKDQLVAIRRQGLGAAAQ
jgi:uncharacterized coiled-coil protein SlyX